MHWVSTGQCLKRTFQTHILNWCRSIERLIAGAVIATHVYTAVWILNALWASTSSHGTLKTILVCPTVEKVGVKTVAGGVAHGVDPVLKWSVLGDGASIVLGLELQTDDGNRVGRWAHASVVCISGSTRVGIRHLSFCQ